MDTMTTCLSEEQSLTIDEIEEIWQLFLKESEDENGD